MANPAAVNYLSKNLADDPASEAPTLDLVHLSRQTFGDHALEIELLSLFERQAEQLARRLGEPRQHGDKVARMDLAHMLKGSARSVGAFAVADAAELYETALRDGDPAQARLCDGLIAKIAAARAAIAGLL